MALISLKGPNLTKVSSFSGVRFSGITEGALKDLSIFSTASFVISRFHLPLEVLNGSRRRVTV